MTLIGILALVVALVISIALHEVGHMVPAKKFGVKVTRYMVGFGPTIWSTKKGDTEYGAKAVLLGGYIRMIGMFPPGPDGKIKASSTGRLGTLIEQARESAAGSWSRATKRTFYNLSVPKKLVVMLGGPTMNLLIALVLFTVVFAGFGTRRPAQRCPRSPRVFRPPPTRRNLPWRGRGHHRCRCGRAAIRRPDRGLGCGARVRLAHPQPGHP